MTATPWLRTTALVGFGSFGAFARFGAVVSGVGGGRLAGPLQKHARNLGNACAHTKHISMSHCDAAHVLSMRLFSIFLLWEVVSEGVGSGVGGRGVGREESGEHGKKTHSQWPS